MFAENLLETQVLLRRRDFDALFDGFLSLKAITYVASPDLLLEFFDKRGFAQLEVIVGESLADSYHQALSQKELGVTQILATRMAEGSLKVLIPSRTIHTKLYILERPGVARLVLTSANLTETAREASRQINYAWYSDFVPGHPWLGRVLADYQKHAQLCQLFMGDLVELMKTRDEEGQRQAIEAWLKGQESGRASWLTKPRRQTF